MKSVIVCLLISTSPLYASAMTPLENTVQLIQKKMDAQQDKNDVKCWSTTKRIEETISTTNIDGEALQERGQISSDFIRQVWVFAQNLHKDTKVLTDQNIQESFDLVKRFSINRDEKNKLWQVYLPNSRYAEKPLTITDLDLKDFRKTSDAWRILYAVASNTAEDKLHSGLNIKAVEKLADYADFYSLVIWGYSKRIAEDNKSALIRKTHLKHAAKFLSSPDSSVYGWAPGRNYLPRAYAQSAAYMALKIKNLEDVNGKFDQSKLNETIQLLINKKTLTPDALTILNTILEKATIDIWQTAQKHMQEHEVYVNGRDLYKSVMSWTPYEVDGTARLHFLRVDGSKLSYSEFESDRLRDETIHWRLLQNILTQKGKDSDKSSKNLYPLDVYAAEEISEFISNYMTAVLRESDLLTKEKTEVQAKDIQSAHSRLWKKRDYVSKDDSISDIGPQVQNTTTSFVEKTTSLGIQPFHKPELLKDTDMAKVSLMAFDAFRGVATADINNDDLADLFLAEESGNSRLYINTPSGKLKSIPLPQKYKRVTGGYFNDYNNDGCIDLYLTRVYESSVLLKGNCKAGFQDVTQSTGLFKKDVPTTGAIWFDYNRDGNVDLYVLTTGDFRNGFLPTFGDVQNAQPNILFKNNGDGTFSDVTSASGLGDKRISLAGMAADLNNDGWQDLYLANDMQPNSYYRNNKDGTFRFVSKELAVDDWGNGMGVSYADINHDGFFDILLTNIALWNPALRYVRPQQGTVVKSTKELDATARARQANRLYVSNGKGGYTESFLDLAGSVNTGWGWNNFFFDYDNDGDQDIYVINGFRPESLYHHSEPKMLLENKDGRFIDITDSSGASFRGNSRGGVFWDVNNDGRQDLVVTGLHQPKVYMNNSTTGNWLKVKLNALNNKLGFGSKVKVLSKQTQMQEMGAQGGGFISSILLPLHFGLGDLNKVDIEVTWNDGTIEVFKNISANQTTTLVQSTKIAKN